MKNKQEMTDVIHKALDVEKIDPVGFDPFTNVADDFFLLRQARHWLENEEDRYSWFYICLSEQLRSRDPYYTGTINQYELYYMDLYKVGDFARAFYLAATTDRNFQETYKEIDKESGVPMQTQLVALLKKRAIELNED